MLLSDLKIGESGTIAAVLPRNYNGSAHRGRDEFRERILDIGFVPGTTVEMMHRAPLGGHPLVVRLRGTLVGLRKEESNLIQVERIP